jgi:hypothetical protein
MLATPQLTVRTMVDASFTAAVLIHQARLRAQLAVLLALPPRALVDRPSIVIADSAETCARLAKGQVAQGFFAFRFSTGGHVLEDAVYSWADPGQRTFAGFPSGLLAHEETHQVLQGCAGRHRLPIFLDEGIATVMQGWDVERDLEDNLRLMRPALPPGPEVAARLPRLSELAAVSDWNQGDAATVALRYAAAGSFVRWMLVNPVRRGALIGIVAEACRGGDPARRFGAEEGQPWERGWRAWMSASEPGVRAGVAPGPQAGTDR